MAQALREGISAVEVTELTDVNPWFVRQMAELIEDESEIIKWVGKAQTIPEDLMLTWKRSGFSDEGIAYWCESTEKIIRERRKSLGVIPAFKMVDTCAAEFESQTPYLYSTYESKSDPVVETGKKKVIILGSGPNRIGQGIEFDYCCVRATFALHEEGYESIMVNCNPETVSTDYDVSDKLYFEPLFLEDILNIIERENPLGIVVHFGGQTPLNLSRKLADFNVPIIGTSAEAIEIAEDRDKFRALCNRLSIRQPESLIVSDRNLALEAAASLGYPLLVRPSFVLGGVGMEILYHPRDFQRWLMRGIEISVASPLLIDRFLANAVEVDVDAVSDGETVIICGVLEQIQEAGVHSGDSASCLPPMTLSTEIQAELERQTKQIALELQVKGLINIQYAIEDGKIFILEVNPRASRTVPFSSKARGIAFASLAMKAMLGP